MFDRYVRQIDPHPNDENPTRKRITDFEASPNIVLVGDPGAGKSYVFDALAKASNSKLQSARDFLNTPAVPTQKTLFIDALDEKRAGRSDQATIDQIVQKLFLVNAPRVRLACREHDWLGDTDLAAFHPYFAQSGNHVVLALEPLTETEQFDILKSKGVGNPTDFIQEAKQRGLAEFLVNPQNLIMLAEAVQGKGWPTTRLGLLEETTIILLKEHNQFRVRSGSGRYTVREVRPPASAACALRLISDVEGISLSESEVDPAFPSYRSIPFAKPELTLASLGRRLFRALGNEAVEYSHRVRAEYAAADWLAQSVRDGLPLSRIQAIIGVDGVPAPELRGMHAWLAVLLPEFSDAIFMADPFGVLIYGDPHSLNLSQRIRLLQALSRLAEADPYFRPEQRAPVGISALFQLDMTHHLSALLRDPSAPFGVKLLIVESLGTSPNLPNLQNELLTIIADRKAPFGLKAPAIETLARFGAPAIKKLVTKYKRMGTSAADIRLRAYVLATHYSGNFTAKDVSDLYKVAWQSQEDLLTGVLWQIGSSIPVLEIPTVLDAIGAEGLSPAIMPEHRRRYEHEHFIERLIIRLVEDRTLVIPGDRLRDWIKIRNALRDEYDRDEFCGLKPLLAERTDLARSLFEAVVDSYVPGNVWLLQKDLLGCLPFSLSAEPLRWLEERISRSVDDSAKRRELYEIALAWAFGGAEENIALFERLYYLADGVNDLNAIRGDAVANQVQGWKAEENRRTAERLTKRLAGRLKNLHQFENDIASITNGKNHHWMNWAGNVYFSNFADVDDTKTPRGRLEEELGAENAVLILGGLKQFVRNATLPTLDDLATADLNNAYPRLWYAFLAGMDELWLERPSILGLSEETLKALLGIELLLPTSIKSVAGEIDVRSWKTHTASQKPDLFKEVYMYFVDASLKAGKQHVPSLYRLLNDPALVHMRPEITLQLLDSPQTLPPQVLEDLLKVALTEANRSRVLEILRKKIEDITIASPQRDLWCVAAYLLAPDVYQLTFEQQAALSPTIVWHMRALTSHDRDRNTRRVFQLSPAQMELFAIIAGGHYADTSHPTSAWSGDENPWDASDFVRSLISMLSAVPSRLASEALQRLTSHRAMVSYTASIKHALANQRTRYREMAYSQPSWAKVIATLSNQGPANIADLLAIVMDHLQEISRRIGTENINVYKDFWNEDNYGRPSNPKTEETARNVLLGLLRPRLARSGAMAEPEGHMVADKRADIVITVPGHKLIIELKRDIHPELWSAPITQLQRLYTRDPDANGYGIFGAFWYGSSRRGNIPRHPKGLRAPKSASELEGMLNDLLLAAELTKLRAVVIDVSIPDGQSVSKKISATKHNGLSRKKEKRPKSASKKKSDLRRPKKKAALSSRTSRASASRVPKQRPKTKR